MIAPLNPAPMTYDRTLALTTMHYRAPSFGTVATPDTDALRRMRDAEGEDLDAAAWVPFLAVCDDA